MTHMTLWNHSQPKVATMQPAENIKAGCVVIVTSRLSPSHAQ